MKGPGLSELRVIPTIRSSNFERQVEGSDRVVIYTSKHEDLDISSMPPRSRQVGLVTAWTWAFRQRWTVVELPEPLWLRALPLTISMGVALRIAGLIQRRRTIIVTYALENNTPRRLLRGLPPATRPIFFQLLRLFCGFVYDRVAFGSDAAHRCYCEVKILSSKCATAIFSNLLPPCPKETDVTKRQIIAFVAALEERKGLRTLLNAWRLANLADWGWMLHIAGSGPLGATVLDAASTDSSIHYLGELDRGQVHRLFAESSIVVLPSHPEGRWTEQIGLSIVEGLAHGCHVVTSSDTGLADWLIKRGHTVLPSGFAPDDLGRALRLTCSKLVDPAAIRSSLPSNDGRTTAEKWMYQ